MSRRGDKSQRRRIYAIAQACRILAVIEALPHMCLAARAANLRPRVTRKCSAVRPAAHCSVVLRIFSIMRQMNAMSTHLASVPTPPAPADTTSENPVTGAPHACSAWRLGPRIPQSRGTLLHRIGQWGLQIAGWRFEGAMPNLPRFVVIVAPHTSNWDFLIGLLSKWALGLNAGWLGKDTLFRPPLGWFMRANGGVPVDRHNRQNVVEQSVHVFHSREAFVLVLAPEGTRKKVSGWRSGFWHVAKAAGVPICCVALDWERKVVRLGPTAMATENDAAVGIARFRGYFAGVRGYNPAQQP